MTIETSHLKIPTHIAIIADGNGRWAKLKGLPRTAGHAKGMQTVEKLIPACQKAGIKVLTFYLFSTENWKRSEEEVGFLMNLFYQYLTKEFKKLIENKIRFKVLGDKSRFSPEIQTAMTKLENDTKDFTDFTLNCALNYGGHSEIVNATKNIIKDIKTGKIKEDDINEVLFENYLYTAGQPAPDLIIRTSGEQRLSGFLLWQSSYTEFYFPKFHFPDFDEEKLQEAIKEYSTRDRRYGKV